MTSARFSTRRRIAAGIILANVVGLLGLTGATAAHAETGPSAVARDPQSVTACQDRHALYSHHRADQREYHWSPFAQGDAPRPLEGPAIPPGTFLSFRNPTGWFQPAAFPGRNPLSGVNEYAPHDRHPDGTSVWPMPGKRKFQLIGVLRDARGARMTWYSNGPVRNGAFVITGYPGTCIPTPANASSYLTVEFNDDVTFDNSYHYRVEYQWRR